MIVTTTVDRRVTADASNVLVPAIVAKIGDVTSDSVTLISDALSAAEDAGQSVLPLEIDSSGGDVYALLGMLDVIKSSRVQVATICVGRAFSAGAVLLACGGAPGLRWVAPRATVMVHDAWDRNSAPQKVDESEANARELKRLGRKIAALMDRSAGKPRGTIASLVHERSHVDVYLRPAEVVGLGLADRVGLPSLRVRVGVEYELS